MVRLVAFHSAFQLNPWGSLDLQTVTELVRKTLLSTGEVALSVVHWRNPDCDMISNLHSQPVPPPDWRATTGRVPSPENSDSATARQKEPTGISELFIFPPCFTGLEHRSERGNISTGGFQRQR